MSHAVVAPPYFPTVISAANRRANTKAKTTRTRSSGGASLGFGGKRKDPPWQCVQGCGACCKLDKGPSFATPEEIFQDPSDVQLYRSLIGPDGWCTNFDKTSRTCSIYPDRPYFCRVEPEIFQTLFGIDKKRFNKEACSCCRDTIKVVYGSKSKELDNFNHVIKSYCLTLYGGDYDNSGTYGEPLPSSQEGFDLFFPDPVTLPNGGGEVYHTRRLSNENALTEQAYEGEQLPYGGSSNWLGMYESYFNRCWEDDQLSLGSGVGTFNNAYDGGLEKAEDAYEGEEQRGSYYSYDDDVEMQAAYDYNTWFGAEYGNEVDVHDYGTDGADTAHRYYNWDEMKLCESIFGEWPCLSKHNQESYAEP